jgi:uncharacterized Zn finger protein (UPF0148 family)
MRLGPLSYQSAFDLLRAKGYQPVAGSSRFEDAGGRTGRIVEAEGRGDTWYAETEERDADLARVGQPCPECGTAMIDYGAHGTTCPRCAETEERVLQGEFEPAAVPVSERTGDPCPRCDVPMVDLGEGGLVCPECAEEESWFGIEHEANSGSGTFAEGFAAGRRDRQAGHVRQLCTTGTGERPPVVKRQGRDYYHGYKAAAEGATSEPSAYLAYRAKHRGTSGMAANGPTGVRAMMTRQQAAMERFIEYAMDQAGLSREEAERALAVYRREKVIRLDPMSGQFNFKHGAFGEADVLQRAARMTGNPVHLKLDGNFSFGIGSEDDKAMKKNARSPESCDECGGDFEIDGSGVANHLTEDGDVDYDADADHVPYSSEHEPNAARGHCRICGERLAPGSVLCAHHEREGLSNDPRWADLPSWEEARGQIHRGQHSLVENARKNVSAVINAFEARRPKREATCSTDGDTVYSYGLPIASRIHGEVVVLDPKESPSATTSGQIRAVLAAFPGARKVANVKHVPGHGVIAAHGEPMRANAGPVRIMRLDRTEVPTGQCACGSGEPAYAYGVEGYSGYVDAERACARKFIEEAIAEGLMVPEGHERNADATGGAADFEAMLRRYASIGDRHLWVEHEHRLGGPSHYYESVYVNYVNLPTGIGGAGGGAEAENNRLLFKIDGFHGADPHAPPPRGKVKVDMLVSALPREYSFRAKTGSPEVIAKYLGAYLTRIATEVPPNYTHTAPHGSQTPNWGLMLDLGGVERRLGADHVAAVLASVTPHAIALGLAGDALDANDVKQYEAYTSLARMIDDGDLDDLIATARGRG